MARDPGKAGEIVTCVGYASLATLGLLLETCKPASIASGSDAQAPGPVHFSVEEGTRLVAQRGSERAVVLDLSRRLPANRFGDSQESFDDYVGVEIAATGSFEHDGVEEAIVSLFMGGNACPGPAYALVRAAATTAIVSPSFGECLGPLHVVSGDASTDQFVIEADDRRYTFRPAAGGVVAEAASVLQPIETNITITYAQAEAHGGRQVLHVDLDGDGKPDQVDCSALRLLTCILTASDGKPWGTILAPDRLGVLPSTSRAHRDLVVGTQKILCWNGHEYE